MMDLQMGATFLFLALLFLTLYYALKSSASNILSMGSSLSVENPGRTLISPNGIFSAGLFSVGENAYCFGIWFTEPSPTQNITVVWMANRDQPVNGRHSELFLQKNGNLVLTDAGRNTIWSSNTFSNSLDKLQLYDTGNLVLLNLNGVTLWESFASPTDTLLPHQPLTRNTKLVSSRSLTNYSSGFYSLFFDNDNILRLLYDGPEHSSTYWPDPWSVSWKAGRFIFNNSRIAMFNSLGNFSASDDLTVLSVDYGAKLQRILKTDVDGNSRLYSRAKPGEEWVVSWQAVSQPCQIHGICGANSWCSHVPSLGRKCSCVPGFKVRNQNDWSSGCEPDFNISYSCNATVARDQFGFMHLPRVEFFGYDYLVYNNYTLEGCKTLCLGLCNCTGFQYKYDFGVGSYNCYPKSQLRNGYRSPGFDGDLYLKLPKATLSLYNVTSEQSFDMCTLTDKLATQLDRTYGKGNANGSVMFMLRFASGLGGIEIVCVFLVWFCVTQRKAQGREDPDLVTQGYIHAATGFRRFSYSELKKATRGFKEEIGSGGGGIVYKGLLSDQRVAAIKKLRAANQGEAEFLAEVSLLGKLYHMNLIEMWGYCVEGKHRLLVYEYMEHGSLAESLSSNVLDWKKRFEIAVGTAKGLAYLHEECLEWVLHCDVKPQNILLDSNYQPKVADFGLSKLFDRGELKNSSFSRIRGTRGYLAPEWVHNLPITSKVDVYSYGIVVLEILIGKNPIESVQAVEGGGETQQKMVKWVREKMNAALASAVTQMGDEYERGQLEILVKVALQCLEEDKDARPTMSQVVKMLLHHENNSL